MGGNNLHILGLSLMISSRRREVYCRHIRSFQLNAHGRQTGIEKNYKGLGTPDTRLFFAAQGRSGGLIQLY
jgi:hypothetical protein